MRVTWRFLLTRICRARSPSVRATWILWPCGSRRSTSAATSPITAALPLMRLAHTRLCSGRGGGLSPARVVGSLRKRLSTTCWGVRIHAARMNTAATVAIFLLKDFFDAAHGNRRTGDFRNALAGFPERSLHRCLDHALLQLIRERACWQLQSFIQRMDARGARPAVAHSLDLDGAKDGLQHASMQAPVGI